MNGTRNPSVPVERTGHPAPDDLARLRQSMEAARIADVWRTDLAPEETITAGVRTLRFRPEQPARASVLHIHGGGFRIGCPEMVGRFAVDLVQRCGVEVICPAYRLAPQHPFPAGLNDVLAVLAAMRQIATAPIILSGDSAGGGLAAAAMAVTITQGWSPRALILLSPWLDLTLASEGYERHAASDPLFSRDAATQAARLYLQGASPHDPLISPLLGTLDGFAPTFIAVGSGEVLGDDGRRFHEALCVAGVPAELLDVPGMEHVAVTRSLALTGAAETLDAVTTFIDRQLTL